MREAERFQAQVAGTNDNREEKAADNPRKAEQKPRRGKYDIVEGLGKNLGKRLLQTGKFEPGDALWIKVEVDTVVELSYSAIWRRVAEIPVDSNADPMDLATPKKVMRLSDLLGDLGPCNPNVSEAGVDAGPRAGQGVCMSCSIFGMVGPENSKGKEGQGYAGHIRFGSLNLVKEQEEGVKVHYEENFMPLASPRPSNAQFYLTNPRSLNGRPDRRQIDNAENTAHWDRRHLKGFNTKLAGRKFYWNHDPLRKPGGRVYYKAFYDANPELVSKRTLVLPEEKGVATRFVGEVAFDQITAAELLSLWFLFDHVALFKALKIDALESTVVRLGGGKPLGFGAAKPHIVSFNVSTVQNRYLAAQPDYSGGKEAVTPLGIETSTQTQWFKKLRERITPDDARPSPKDDAHLSLEDNIRALQRVMNLDGLGGDKRFVAYPPNAEWSQYGEKKFHESYEFFTKTNGRAYADGWEDWKPLPVLKPSNNSQIIEW